MMEFEFPKCNLDMDFDDDTGFPFDAHHSTSSTSAQQQPNTVDGRDHPRDGAEDSRLRFDDHLRDIATRYPEFAEHIRPSSDGGSLRGFPSRDRVHQRRDPWGQDDFDFGREFDIPPEFAESRFARPREFYPPNTQTYSSASPPPTFQSDSRAPVHPQTSTNPQSLPKPPKSTPAHPPQAKATRSAAQSQGIQQSNTVDLGQVQPPSTSGFADGAAEGRGQRSMSAPPTDGGLGTATGAGGKRYVSSIQIPVLKQPQEPQPAPAQQDMGASNSTSKIPPLQSQQQTPNKPHEYVIPIHIEGRDEPITPKQTYPPNNQYMQEQQQPSGAQNQPLFNTMKDQFKQQQEEVQREQQQKFYEQQEKQQKDTEQHEQQKPQIVKPTSHEMIQLIQKDVSELMSKVEKFTGRPKDREYVYLDEMLTRNLLKLDNVETEGKDAIRQARRAAIKCIEGCISILEAKAKQNAAMLQDVLAIEDKTVIQKQEDPNMAVQKSSSSSSQKEEIKTGREKENESKSNGDNAPAEISKT